MPRPDHVSTFNAVIEWTAVRRWKRYNVDMRVRVTYVLNGSRSQAHGRGSDVSEGGMSLYVPVEMVVGSVVELDLVLPYSQQPLKLRGTIRNRNNFRYGIEFLTPSPADQEVVLRACKALALVQ